MNKSIILGLAVAGTLLSAGAAHAGNVQWSVGINLPVPGIVLPLPGLVVTGGPVYQQPSYGYRAEPVYAPAPVYYAPEPVYYPRHPQWRHHYRPAPVVVEVPRYRHDWQPVAYPRYGHDRREWRHEERRDERHERHERHDRRD
jgi:hypothetical protein